MAAASAIAHGGRLKGSYVVHVELAVPATSGHTTLPEQSGRRAIRRDPEVQVFGVAGYIATDGRDGRGQRPN